MNNYREVFINPVKVFCVTAVGIKNSRKAFDELELKLTTLSKRKFYGTLSGSSKNGIYLACFVIQPMDCFKDLETWVIPGGKYAKSKLTNWSSKLKFISLIFKDMEKKYKTDPNRPYVEFYRSQKELILLMPIK